MQKVIGKDSVYYSLWTVSVQANALRTQRVTSHISTDGRQVVEWLDFELNTITSSMYAQFVCAYIDDVIVFSSN